MLRFYNTIVNSHKDIEIWSSERPSFPCNRMFELGLQMADTHVSMSLRMRLYWLHSKKKWKGSSISPQLHKGFSIMFLS